MPPQKLFISPSILPPLPQKDKQKVGSFENIPTRLYKYHPKNKKPNKEIPKLHS